MQRFFYGAAAMLAAIAFLAPLALANAQDVQTSEPPLTPIQKLRLQKQTGNEMRKDLIQNIKDIKIDAKEELKGLRVDTLIQLKNATTGPAKKAILRDANVERKSVIDMKRASTTPIKQKLRVLAHTYLGLAALRFEIALQKLDTIAARIESRISKLETAGVDVSAVESTFNSAKIAIGDATADVQALADYVASIEDGSDPREVREAVISLVREANEGIKTAHKALMETARVLSSAAKEFKTSTTTPIQ